MGRFQSISVATQSLANPYGFATLPPELYVPLWWYSGSSASMSSNLNTYQLQKGSTSMGGATGSSVSLFTCNYPTGTQAALEAAIWTSGITVTLFDITLQSDVSGSSITTTSSTATVVRSGKFTLTKGHVYGVHLLSTGSPVYCTDVSIIVFPNQQLLAQGSLSNITLGTVGQKLTEAYIPLWVYSSGAASSSFVAASASGLLQKGGTNTNASSSSTTKLHTLNSNWSASQKFAFEASIYTQNGSYVSYASLWDITAGSLIGGSQVSTNSTTATLLRSGQFTLTPGHVYGVAMWSSSSSTNCYLTKAHLVALGT